MRHRFRYRRHRHRRSELAASTVSNLGRATSGHQSSSAPQVDPPPTTPLPVNTYRQHTAFMTMGNFKFWISLSLSEKTKQKPKSER